MEMTLSSPERNFLFRVGQVVGDERAEGAGMAVIRRTTGQMRGQTRTLQKQNVFAMFAQTQRLPCAKGAGATAPEGL